MPSRTPSVPVGRQHLQDLDVDRHRPLLHHAGGAQRAGGYHRQVDRQTVAVTVSPSPKRSSETVSSSRKRSSVRVLAHFVPGEKVLKFLAPYSDWLDVGYCGEDDDDTFYAELPDAEVIWHVLRPLSASDLRQERRLPLGHN